MGQQDLDSELFYRFEELKEWFREFCFAELETKKNQQEKLE